MLSLCANVDTAHTYLYVTTTVCNYLLLLCVNAHVFMTVPTICTDILSVLSLCVNVGVIVYITVASTNNYCKSISHCEMNLYVNVVATISCHKYCIVAFPFL